MTENIQPDIIIQHDVEDATIQPVYAGDTILDRHINDLQDAIKKIQNVLGETTNDQLINVINNFSDLTAQINDLHNSLISKGNSNILKEEDDNGKLYLTTQKASTEQEGVVKFASNIDNCGEDLVVSAAQFNNKFTELKDTLKSDYVLLDDNSKIPQKYFPDNLLSDRVFGGIITASKDGDSNITFTPEITINTSTQSIYNFQIVTDGSNIEGKLPNAYNWEEGDENIITISSGDWIYSYYDSDNGRKYRIIKNLDDVTILGPNNTVVQKDNLNRYDLSSLFNNLKVYLEEKIKEETNTRKNEIDTLKNELKGEIDERTKGVTRFYSGKVTKQLKDFTSGKLQSSTSNKAEIVIPLSKDIKKGKISILSFYGTKNDIFYLDLRDSGVSTDRDINTDKINEKDPNLEFIQGYYYHTGRRLYSNGGDYSTDSGWEYDASNDWYAKGYICSYWEVVVRSGGLYYNKQQEQYEIRLRLEGVYSRNTNPTSFNIYFTYEIWDYGTGN